MWIREDDVGLDGSFLLHFGENETLNKPDINSTKGDSYLMMSNITITCKIYFDDEQVPLSLAKSCQIPPLLAIYIYRLKNLLGKQNEGVKGRVKRVWVEP